MGFDAWGDGRSPEEHVAACLAAPKYEKGRWWVIEDGGSPASALIVYPLTTRGGLRAAGLGSIQTAPPLRRRGLAARLIRDVLAGQEAGGVGVFFLHSDIGPGYYRRFGFVALPGRLQRKAGSSAMVRCPAPYLRGILEDPAFEPPAYF